jgi:23S rRNA (uracil1939-C5)-methyltransferase
MNQNKDENLAEIRDLSHDGLGIAKVQGKTVFVEGALPTELVNFNYTKRKTKFDIGQTTKILKPSLNRIEPLCQHYNTCGGCALQHVTVNAQIEFKQNLLLKQLKHFGSVTPEEVLLPIQGPSYQYRRRARLSVQYLEKHKTIVLGFKEKLSHSLVPIINCEILDPVLSKLLPEIKIIIASLEASRFITQIELAKGDNYSAIVIRHLRALSKTDQNLLIEFAKDRNIILYLQTESKDSNLSPQSNPTFCLWKPEEISSHGHEYLTYSLPAFNLTFQFHPLDFIQVNAEINQAMVSKVIELLNPKANDSILDLFCGLGNFTLPLAQKAKQVIGIEGSASLVERGNHNAKFNGIDNVKFYASDLKKQGFSEPWAQKKYDKILLDPPRTGAMELMKFIASLQAKTIIYISCDPATLARDLGELIKKGYKLKSAGIMDMFPQTSHVESIGLLHLE